MSSWFVVLVAMTTLSCSTTGSRILDDCADRESQEIARSPRELAIGSPPVAVARVPPGWTLDFSLLKQLDRKEALERLALRIQDEDCGTYVFPELTLEIVEACSSDTPLTDCVGLWHSWAPLVLPPRNVVVAGFKAVEVTDSGDLITRFEDGTAATSRMESRTFLLSTPRGVLACGVSSADIEKELGDDLEAFCGSIRIP